MTHYAKINEDLTVHSLVKIDDPGTIPQHKTWSDGGLFVRPIEHEEKPAYNPLVESLATAITVAQDKVTYSYSVVPHTRENQVSSVKGEAGRRILDRYPQYKQANMTARGVELQDLWRRNGSWTQEEQAEADALQEAWDWIKEVRLASDTIESLETIPSDFNDDSRWPA